MKTVQEKYNYCNRHQHASNVSMLVQQSPSRSRVSRILGGITLLLASGFAAAQTANSNAIAAHNQTNSSQSLMAAASASEWQKLGKTFDFGDQKAFYVDQGAGKATVAIHGFPTSSWDFRRMASSFSKSGRFIAPDLLGFGFSGKSADTKYTIATHADLIVALIQHLGLTSARLIGADVGASVVQELLARQLDAKLPFTIESAVFINGSLFAEQFKPTSGQSSLLGAFGAVANKATSESAVVGGLIQVTGPEKRIPAAEWGSVWTLVNYPSDSRILHKVLPSTSEREANDSRWTNAICKTKTPQKMILGLADPTGSRQMYELAQAT